MVQGLPMGGPLLNNGPNVHGEFRDFMSLQSRRSFQFLTRDGHSQAPGFQWSAESMQAGLCGGAYFRTEAVLDSRLISKTGSLSD